MTDFNLLFIDDESEILDSYKTIFTKKDRSNIKDALDLFDDISLEDQTESSNDINYNILLASSGEDGVKIVQEMQEKGTPIHVAFVDMRMPPGMNGGETSKIIRSIDDNIEIVIVTAYSDLNLSKIVEKVGAPDKLLYLKKPFDNQEIKQIAHNLCTKYFNTEIKDHFLGNVSHELKTPLSSILGYSQLYLEEFRDFNEEATDYIETISKNASLLLNLIEDLLMSFHLKQRQNCIALQAVDLSPLLTSIGKMMLPLFREKMVALDLSVNNSSLSLADGQALSRAFINILSNALKFTPKGGKVTVSLSTINEFHQISIIDTGIGIHPDEIKNICQQFFRCEDIHHSTPGLGLGLFISDSIIKQHNGNIQFKSQLKKGTTVEINLPVTKES